MYHFIKKKKKKQPAYCWHLATLSSKCYYFTISLCCTSLQEKESLDEDGKKKKKKFRLELHTQQIFRDSDDVSVLLS